MKKNNFSGNKKDSLKTLRKRAEEKLSIPEKKTPLIKDKETDKIIHELQVHQIELEMQNDEIRKSMITLEESREKYVDLYDFAPSGYLTLTKEALIKEANLTAANLLGVLKKELINSRFRKYILNEDIEKWDNYFSDLLKYDEKRNCELRIKRKVGPAFYASMECRKIKIEAGTTEIRIALNDVTERKQIEGSLHKSEVRYRRLHESMTDCFVQVEMSGKIVDYNQQYLDLLGYTKKEIMTLKYNDITPKHWHEFEKNIVKNQILTSGHSAVYEKEYIKKDGTVFPVELRTFLLFDEQGNPSGMWAIVRDITKRKQQEKALRESEENYRNIYDNALEGIFKSSLEGKVLSVNNAMAAILGYDSPEEFINTVNDAANQLWINPEDRFRWTSMLESNNILLGYEAKWKRKDGRIIWVSFNARLVRDNSGNKLYYEGFVIDITERKQVDEKIRASEDKYRELIETTDTGYVILDESGIILDANRKYIDLTGHDSLDEVLNHNVLEWTSENYKTINEKAVKECMDNGFIRNLEIEYVKKDGVTIPVEINATVIKTEPGIQILSLCRDITKRKTAENKIRKSESDLRKLNSEKDKFFSIIAHDLRSPLSGFQMITEILAKNIKSMSLKELERISNKLNKSVTSLNQLLNNLLSWSLLQRGLSGFSPVNISLTEVITECIEEENIMLTNKNICLENSVCSDIQVFADEKMLESIVRNILTNAIKFTNKNGKIKISAMKKPDDMVEVCIEDSGIGMDEELVNRLFHIDTKVKREGTENEPSSGLGFLLCKEFIEKNGGTIRVESEVEKGSSIYFTLPGSEINKNTE
jgi:PAS domain S-box-containing protein